MHGKGVPRGRRVVDGAVPPRPPVPSLTRPIDLLHVDGFHTWEAVSHDWDTYGPLVRPGGLALFHDVNVGHEGVTRFWKR